MNNITNETIQKCQLMKNSSEECILEQSKDNKNVFKLKRNNRVVYLGSKYNAKREIEKIMLNKDEINIKTTIVVFGLGTGEHILELFKYTSENKIIIIEPNINIIREFLKLEYSKNIVDDDRVILYNYEKESVYNFLNSNIYSIEVKNFQYVVFANYPLIYNEEYTYFSKKLKEFIADTAIQYNTMNAFSFEFSENYMRNVPHIVEAKRLNDFKGKFKNSPAVIVSAGPSLEKNIDYLKKVQEKVIIITGGRTLGPLIKKGIKPDFVCVVDPSEGAYKIMENDLNNYVPMVFCEYTNANVVDEYKGEKIYFPQGTVKETTEELIGIDTDSLLSGGSVAHICTSFGVYIGCDPIIFIGQDCAYTNDKHHADIADTLEGEENGNYDLYVDDIYGNKVATDYILNSFRKDMEANIKKFSNNTFINSTEGGANMEGAKVMTLKESTEKYCIKALDKHIDKIFIKSSEINKGNVKKKLKNILGVLDKVHKQSEIGVKESQKLLSYYLLGKKVNVDSILERLDKVDTCIKEAREILILESIITPVTVEVLSSRDFLEKFNENKKEKGIRIARRSEALYEGIFKVVRDGKKLIEKCIDNIK